LATFGLSYDNITHTTMLYFVKTKEILIKYCLTSAILLLNVFYLAAQKKQLMVQLLGQPPKDNIVAFYDGYDVGKGNTSVEFDTEINIKHSKVSPNYGYFTEKGEEIAYVKRNRDLGQTFKIVGDAPRKLKSITVITNRGTNAVRKNMYGKAISIQILKVEGMPRLNKNGTDSTEAYHGFPHNRVSDSISPVRDDYFEGEIYKHLALLEGGFFPLATDFGITETDSISPDNVKLKSRYLQFTFLNCNIVLEPNQTYAFLLVINNPGDHVGFSLGNHYYGSYANGHGIRRDGDGIFPPTPYDITQPQTARVNQKAIKAAQFPKNMKKRLKISPGTNGYPDVDTYRDLCFYIEAI
jgi:hypothetical protein